MDTAALRESVESTAAPSAESRSLVRRSRLTVGLVLLFLFAATFVHQLPRNCPTPLSRLDLLHALFTAGTLKIDAYDNTPDKATHQGHTYSDKAPGTVVLALPPFALSVVLLKAVGIDLDSPTGWLVSSWVACAGSIALITALGAALLFHWLSRYTTQRAAMITTLALFLGAAPLPYATMMFSHSLVVACIAIALWAVEKSRETTVECPGAAHKLSTLISQPSTLYPAVAGLACGWALASEYTAGIVVAAIFLWLLLQNRLAPGPARAGAPLQSTISNQTLSHAPTLRRSTLLRPCILAALPPLLLIPLYSWLCFGDPFTLPYSLNESFPAMREGLYAIKWPDPETAYNLLLSPTRGLFFWTPFLAIALVGYWDLVKSNQRLFWLTYAVPLLQVLVISGRVWDWQAGPTLGPRYLAPILPLLALPCALGVARFPKIGLSLALVSISLTAFGTLVNASPQGLIYNPLTEVHWPKFLASELQPNLASLLGAPAWLSAAIYLGTIFAGLTWLISHRDLPFGRSKPK